MARLLNNLDDNSKHINRDQTQIPTNVVGIIT